MQPKLRVAVVVVRVIARRCWRSVATAVTSACDPVPATTEDAAVNSARPRLSAHVIGAGVLAGGLLVAACFTQSELARVLELAAALAVAGIATSAVICMVRRHRSSGLQARTRSLLVEAAVEVAPLHRGVWGARVLEVACNPSSLLNTKQLSSRKAGHVAVSALRKKILRRATKAVPVLGSGLDLLDACRTAIGSMAFVSTLERTASSRCLVASV